MCRDQEMHALRSDKPMKLPMAQDAEKLLDQWLVRALQSAHLTSTSPSCSAIANLGVHVVGGRTSHSQVLLHGMVLGLMTVLHVPGL
jgi:hypothetical protein